MIRSSFSLVLKYFSASVIGLVLALVAGNLMINAVRWSEIQARAGQYANQVAKTMGESGGPLTASLMYELQPDMMQGIAVTGAHSAGYHTQKEIEQFTESFHIAFAPAFDAAEAQSNADRTKAQAQEKVAQGKVDEAKANADADQSQIQSQIDAAVELADGKTQTLANQAFAAQLERDQAAYRANVKAGKWHGLKNGE